MDGVVPPAPTAPLPPWVGRWPLGVRELYGMVAAGLLAEGDRVELIEGELGRMAPMGSPHIGALMALNDLLGSLARGRARISIQCPVRLGPYTEPQPAVALLRPRADDYRRDPPPGAADVLLLVEVADSTLRYDREVKAALYARHGIPEYWIVDLTGRAVLVHRRPAGERYAVRRTARAGQGLRPPGLPGAVVAVADILG